MKTQTYIEVGQNSPYTFTYFKEVKNSTPIPSTATISIYQPGGTAIVTTAAMTIDGVTGVCTYDWNSTGQDMGRAFYVEYILDSGQPVVRFFDIYKYPFANDVTDDDLFNVNKSIRDDRWGQSGSAQSGTTLTLLDANLQDFDDDYWNGGIIEIYQGDRVEERTVTDFVQSTGTITFSPAVGSAVTTESYNLRKSYQDKINLAGDMVRDAFRQKDQRAYLVIDTYQLKWMIIYKFFQEYFGDLIKEEGDENDLQSKRYGDKYSAAMATTTMVYDTNEDGAIDEGEAGQRPLQMRWYR